MTPNSDPRDVEREAFERDAEPMGFDLTRHTCAAPEPWAEYLDDATGHRWGGWLAALSRPQPEQDAPRAEPSEEWWYDLASRHATKDWNASGYLDSVKALVRDALSAPSQAVAAPAVQGEAAVIESCAAACDELASTMGELAPGARECAKKLRAQVVINRALAAPPTQAAPAQAAGGEAELRQTLNKFLDAAAADGFVFAGVDAADLYVALFPDEYERAAAIPAPAPAVEPQEFTTPWPELNDLMQWTFYMGQGPNNHDSVMAWSNALDKVLEQRAPAVEPSAAPAQREAPFGYEQWLEAATELRKMDARTINFPKLRTAAKFLEDAYLAASQAGNDERKPLTEKERDRMWMRLTDRYVISRAAAHALIEAYETHRGIGSDA